MNPYENLLGLSLNGRKPNYFELLGVSPAEHDNEIITSAAKFQVRKLQKHKNGANAEICGKLIEQIKSAHTVLTSPGLRMKYDQQVLAPAVPSVQVATIQRTPRKSDSAKKVGPARKRPRRESNPGTKKYSMLLPILLSVSALALFLVCGLGAVAWYLLNPKTTDKFVSQDSQQTQVKQDAHADVDADESTSKPVETIQLLGSASSAQKPDPVVEEMKPKQVIASVKYNEEAWYAKIADDLKAVDSGDREFIRYFTFSNLDVNTANADEHLATYQRALRKLLNSLSWSPNLAIPKPLIELPSVVRVDLRDLKWSGQSWDNLLLDYPYGYLVDLPAAQTIREQTICDTPILRADWFVASASRPPLYHQLLEIPISARDLEKRLKINVTQDILESHVSRIGIKQSKVAKLNRLIEHHDSPFGAYWKTYDFAAPSETDSDNKSSKNKFTDLLKHPLGTSLGGADGFQESGNQIIFNLPNGLLGFMQTNDLGMRIEKSPTSVVTDMKRPDHAVLTGASCYSCHHNGVIPAADDVREIFNHEIGFKFFDDVMLLYPEKTDHLFADNNKSYRKSLSQINAAAISQATEPINAASALYYQEVSLELAAMELGIDKGRLQSALADLRFDKVTEGTCDLNLDGRVRRWKFENDFEVLVEELKLGVPSRVLSPVAAKKRRRERDERRRVGSVPDFEARLEAANEALADGILVWATDLEAAEKKLVEAIELAPDDESRAKPLSRLASLYEQLGQVDNVVKTYNVILNQTPNQMEMRKPIDRFYRTILRMTLKDFDLDAARFSDALDDGPDSFFMWPDVMPREETIEAIETVFEEQAEKTPDHRLTLLVLERLYDRFRQNPNRLLDILARLKQGGDSINAGLMLVDRKTANALLETGDAAKAALMFEELNDSGKNVSGWDYYRESQAWMQARDYAKALPVLIKAETTFFEEGGSEISLAKIGDSFAEMGEHEKAANTYTKLLETKSILNNVESLQKKLKASLAKSNKPMLDRSNDLLDPKLKFREKAEMFENEKSTILSIRCDNFSIAAQNWVKGERPQQAIDAADKAIEALRQDLRNLNIAYHCDQIGGVYLAVGAKQKAFDCYKYALENAKFANDIKRFQTILNNLAQDSTVKSNGDLNALTDPNLEPRLLAKREESKHTESDVALAIKKLKAVGHWIRAGDQQEIVRCGEEALAAIDRATIPGQSAGPTKLDLALSYRDLVNYHVDLKKFLAEIDAPTEELIEHENSVNAVAAKAKENLANVDAETARKIDPLNPARERAAAFEAEAQLLAKSDPVQAVRRYLDAGQHWYFAKEKEKQRAALKKATGVLTQMSKTERQYVWLCEQISGAYTGIDRQESKKLYEMGYEAESDPKKKEKMKRILNRMKPE